MIDLHMHTIFSDGELIPAELARRAAFLGYRALAFTDHADHSNIDFVIPSIVKAVGKMRGHIPLILIPGIEITHVPPSLIPEIIREARLLGAGLVVVHGETPVEPVEPGTNRAAIEGGADILAHPGLMSDDDFRAAKESGITLEITSRKGHSLANGHIAKWAGEYGLLLTVNTDTHAPSDMVTKHFALTVARAAGIDYALWPAIVTNAERLVQKALGGSAHA